LEAFAGSSISPDVPIPSSLPSLIAGLVLVFAGPALAGCTDPPAPGVEWRRCLLEESELAGANLQRAVLAGADLRRATLFRADLTNADLTGANLSGANLSGAMLGGARWTDGRRICAAGSVGNCQ